MSDKDYHILLVDDELEFHVDFRRAFRRKPYRIEMAANEKELFEHLERFSDFDLLLLDLVLDNRTKEKTGLKLIPQISKKYPNLPIIVITADDKISTVVQAMRKGAKYFLVKDYDYELWDETFRTVIAESKKLQYLTIENQQLKAQVKQHQKQKQQEHAFIGNSPKIEEIKRTLRILSEEPNMTILITGETGVGKEVAARYLHRHGARKDKVFQAVNLSAIQKTLLESELFGHKKGAYTGADRDKEGYFRQANGGILMLDEIGDISMNIQIKLLRFLETRLIRPVGADKDILLDVQIVTATHKNLKKEVAKGKFRADLYQRLKAFTIEIPSLRERKEDISVIMKHYLGGAAIEDILTPDAIIKIMDYHWAGNIRELRNTVNSMLMRKKILRKDKVDVECLPKEIQEFDKTAAIEALPLEENGTTKNKLPPFSREEELAYRDLKHIEEALIKTNSKKKDVVTLLGFKSSDSLRYKIRTYYKKYPQLFDDFQTIKKSYWRIVN